MVRTFLLALACASVAAQTPATSAQPGDRMQQIRQLQAAFEQVAETVRPAVVASRAMRRPTATDAASLSGPPPSYGLGSGVIVRPNGLVLTNQHVIANADRIVVVLAGGQEYEGVLWAQDPRADLAVVRIDADGLPTAPLGDASTVKPGHWIIALGNPFGLGLDGQPALTVGVVSAVGRSLPTLGVQQNRSYCNMIQATADLNPGHSGGPMLDLSGKIVGINTAIFSRTGRSDGIGFAIPINEHVQSVLTHLMAGHDIEYGYVGIWALGLDRHEGEQLLIPDGRGARIWRIDPESPADDAGLQIGDVVLTLNGTRVADGRQLTELICRTPPGQSATVELVRNQKRHRRQVAVIQRAPSGEPVGNETSPRLSAR